MTRPPIALALAALTLCLPLSRAGGPLVGHIFTADPAARVFGGRIYLYATHDLPAATYWDSTEWRLLTSDDAATWRDRGNVFSLAGFSWAQRWAWAPDCVEFGGRFYLILPTDRTKIGVAVGDSPEGPFADAIGRPLIDAALMPEVGSEPIDPAVLVDAGQPYLYFGCRRPKVVKLDPSFTALAGPVGDVVLLDPEGRAIPVAAPNEQPALPQGYGEAPFVFRRGGRYYFVYSNGWAPASTLVYAVGDKPTGPFTYQGEVMEHVACVTHHGSVFEFEGRWYIAYHTSEISGGDTFRRGVCLAPLDFDADGRIVPVRAPTPRPPSR